jgi:tetratricopeptide (TPR) repeat protein
MAHKNKTNVGASGGAQNSHPLMSGSQLAKKSIVRKKMLTIAVLTAALICAGIAYLLLWIPTDAKINNELNTASSYVRDNDTAKALEAAKRALALDPDNVDSLMVVANLTQKDNPEEAKQYFARALEIYKKENDPDSNGKTAINYWGAAVLAEPAGLIDDAKEYYQKVIDAADPEDSYHQSLVKQSKTALKRLK